MIENSIPYLLAYRILLDYLLASQVCVEEDDVLVEVQLDIEDRELATFWITMDSSNYVFVRALMFQNDGWKFYATQTSPLLGKGEPIWALLEKLTSNTTFSQWRENKLQLRLFQLEDIEFSVNIEDFRKDFEQLSNTPWTDPLEEYPFTP